MRPWLIVIVIEVCCSGILKAQTTDCLVSGYLFNADGSLALQAQANVITVVNSGSSFILTPIVLTTDATGFTSLAAPRLATVWIAATALGLTGAGDVAILIPDADSGTLDVLRQSAKPPVSGFNLTSGSSPTLALSLKDFRINLNAGPTALPTTVESFNGRSGAVALTSSDISSALNFVPLDPATVVGAVNASSAVIDDARLPSAVVRQNSTNVFTAPQTFSSRVQVTGVSGPGNTAVTIQKGTGASSALDVKLDGTGKALRFYSPYETQARTYFNDDGMLHTNGWMTISGTFHGTGDGYAIDPPTQDPFMLGIWSDVGGPALQVRSSLAEGSYLFSGLDEYGKYTFSVEASGALRWGASTRAAIDTNLYRIGAAILRTDGAFSTGGAASIGGSATVTGNLAVTSGVLSLGDAQLTRVAPGVVSSSGSFLVNGPLNVGAADTQLYRQSAGIIRTDGSLSVGNTLFFGATDTVLYRNGATSLRTNGSMVLDGKLGIGGVNTQYPFWVFGSSSIAWNKSARFESGANANGSGAILEVAPSEALFGARLYGGRWGSLDRGARLVGVNSIGQENAWVHVNSESSSIALSTAGIDRLTVRSNGSVGVNTASPVADAALDVSGGDTKGFRIAPRSVPGPPVTGGWSVGTIIIDSTGVVYICVQSGAPGTWQKIGAQ